MVCILSVCSKSVDLLQYFCQFGSIASTGMARAEISVCLSQSGIVSKQMKLISWFLHHRRAQRLQFLKTSSSSGKTKGSPQARAIYGTRVGTNWQFSTFKPPPLPSSAIQVQDWSLLITNSKSHKLFWLVPKSTTLVDSELTLNGHYLLCCIIHIFQSQAL